MRLRVLFPLAVLMPVLFAGCVSSTPQDRIAQNRRLFESFSSDVQRKVSAGEVDVGFTPDMVELALGRPDRRFTRTDGTGEAEVWVYQQSEPRVSFGFGLGSGSYHRHSGVNTAVGVTTETGGAEERTRVVFRGGKVSEVETVRR